MNVASLFLTIIFFLIIKLLNGHITNRPIQGESLADIIMKDMFQETPPVAAIHRKRRNIRSENNMASGLGKILDEFFLGGNGKLLLLTR